MLSRVNKKSKRNDKVKQKFNDQVIARNKNLFLSLTESYRFPPFKASMRFFVFSYSNVMIAMKLL